MLKKILKHLEITKRHRNIYQHKEALEIVEESMEEEAEDCQFAIIVENKATYKNYAQSHVDFMDMVAARNMSLR